MQPALLKTASVVLQLEEFMLKSDLRVLYLTCKLFFMAFWFLIGFAVLLLAEAVVLVE